MIRVSASQRKYTQGLAEWSCKQTQVFTLRLLASPFGQGFMQSTVHNRKRRLKNKYTGTMIITPELIIVKYTVQNAKTKVKVSQSDSPKQLQ